MEWIKYLVEFGPVAAVAIAFGWLLWKQNSDWQTFYTTQTDTKIKLLMSQSEALTRLTISVGDLLQLVRADSDVQKATLVCVEEAQKTLAEVRGLLIGQGHDGRGA